MKDIFDEIQRDMDEFFQEIDKLSEEIKRLMSLSTISDDPMTDEEVEYLENEMNSIMGYR